MSIPYATIAPERAKALAVARKANAVDDNDLALLLGLPNGADPANKLTELDAEFVVQCVRLFDFDPDRGYHGHPCSAAARHIARVNAGEYVARLVRQHRRAADEVAAVPQQVDVDGEMVETLTTVYQRSWTTGVAVITLSNDRLPPVVVDDEEVAVAAFHLRPNYGPADAERHAVLPAVPPAFTANHGVAMEGDAVAYDAKLARFVASLAPRTHIILYSCLGAMYMTEEALCEFAIRTATINQECVIHLHTILYHPGNAWPFRPYARYTPDGAGEGEVVFSVQRLEGREQLVVRYANSEKVYLHAVREAWFTGDIGLNAVDAEHRFAFVGARGPDHQHTDGRLVNVTHDFVGTLDANPAVRRGQSIELSMPNVFTWQAEPGGPTTPFVRAGRPVATFLHPDIAFDLRASLMGRQSVSTAEAIRTANGLCRADRMTQRSTAAVYAASLLRSEEFRAAHEVAHASQLGPEAHTLEGQLRHLVSDQFARVRRAFAQRLGLAASDAVAAAGDAINQGPPRAPERVVMNDQQAQNAVDELQRREAVAAAGEDAGWWRVAWGTVKALARSVWLWVRRLGRAVAAGCGAFYGAIRVAPPPPPPAAASILGDLLRGLWAVVRALGVMARACGGALARLVAAVVRYVWSLVRALGKAVFHWYIWAMGVDRETVQTAIAVGYEQQAALDVGVVRASREQVPVKPRWPYHIPPRVLAAHGLSEEDGITMAHQGALIRLAALDADVTADARRASVTVARWIVKGVGYLAACWAAPLIEERVKDLVPAGTAVIAFIEAARQFTDPNPLRFPSALLSRYVTHHAFHSLPFFWLRVLAHVAFNHWAWFFTARLQPGAGPLASLAHQYAATVGRFNAGQAPAGAIKCGTAWAVPFGQPVPVRVRRLDDFEVAVKHYRPDGEVVTVLDEHTDTLVPQTRDRHAWSRTFVCTPNVTHAAPGGREATFQMLETRTFMPFPPVLVERDAMVEARHLRQMAALRNMTRVEPAPWADFLVGRTRGAVLGLEEGRRSIVADPIHLPRGYNQWPKDELVHYALQPKEIKSRPICMASRPQTAALGPTCHRLNMRFFHDLFRRADSELVGFPVDRTAPAMLSFVRDRAESGRPGLTVCGDDVLAVDAEGNLRLWDAAACDLTRTEGSSRRIAEVTARYVRRPAEDGEEALLYDAARVYMRRHHNPVTVTTTTGARYRIRPRNFSGDHFTTALNIYDIGTAGEAFWALPSVEGVDDLLAPYREYGTELAGPTVMYDELRWMQCRLSPVETYTYYHDTRRLLETYDETFTLCAARVFARGALPVHAAAKPAVVAGMVKGLLPLGNHCPILGPYLRRYLSLARSVGAYETFRPFADTNVRNAGAGALERAAHYYGASLSDLRDLVDLAERVPSFPVLLGGPAIDAIDRFGERGFDSNNDGVLASFH